MSVVLCVCCVVLCVCCVCCFVCMMCVCCLCMCVCDDRRRDARMCLISLLGIRGISCKHFSLQRAPHAGVFEAAALFFDVFRRG